MTAKGTLDEWLLQTDTTNFKEGHYFVIEQAMQEYAKEKCKELLEIVAEKAEIDHKTYSSRGVQYCEINRNSVLNAVDLDEFIV